MFHLLQPSIPWILTIESIYKLQYAPTFVYTGFLFVCVKYYLGFVLRQLIVTHLYQYDENLNYIHSVAADEL